MRLTFFASQMTRLAGLHFAPSSFEGHRDALSDLPEEALDAAVSLALRTRDAFPTPFQLRQDADAARPRVVVLPDDRSTPLDEPVVFHALQLPEPIKVTDVWRYYCEECRDEPHAWRHLWCGARHIFNGRDLWPDLPTLACGRRNCAPHRWVQRCPCWDTNPALVKARAAAATYAAEKAPALNRTMNYGDNK